ncbi:MAG: DUF1015 domain-containing protein [Brevefilum sp.]|jgi:hypothetical protein
MTPPHNIGIKIPKLLLPRPGIDLQKWAVIACDQFTSEPEYWDQVEDIVGDAPSTLHMILPEAFLGTHQESERIHSTKTVMQRYLSTNIFHEINDFVYVLRTTGNLTRRGLMVCLDLEHYDYTPGSETLIRATEGTILDRLPPRIRIRENAPLECPHILVLFDDPKDAVFGPIDEEIEKLQKIYSFDLMLGSGHLSGITLKDENIHNHIFNALSALIAPDIFAEKYNLIPDRHKPLLFAMGDGNHSLATAKAIWENIKPSVGMDHPARYALVEIENVHDHALSFEPIHRLLFNIHDDLVDAMQTFCRDRLRIREIDTFETMISLVDEDTESWHQIGMITHEGFKLLEIHKPEENLPVGTLQKFLDAFLEEGKVEHIDYIHGTNVLLEKGRIPGNAGFYLPGMDKSDLFKTVILDGSLPHKTFSMGEAKEKRFYMECRLIQ